MSLVVVGLVITFLLAINARSRTARLEYRLGLLEEAVRTRLRATPGDPLYQRESAEVVPEPREAGIYEREELATQPLAAPTPTILADIPEVAPEAMPEPEPEPEFEPEPEPVSGREYETVEAILAPEPVPEYQPAPSKPRSFSINFEDLFGRRLPIWAGGITLAIAGVLIVRYAIAAGFFTPWMRVMGGFLFGTGLISGAEAAMRNEDRVRDPRVRQALSGAGLATLYATILMASNGYGLIGPLAAFFGMAAVTAGALALSVRFGPPSALLGLAGGLATPALVGSLQPDVPMLSVYLALTIAALATVSRMQRWAWLGVAALLGGAGWSAWLIATGALGAIESLSIGGLVILLSFALPFIAFTGDRGAIQRMASILIGSAELAVLVAKGGFEPLQWGLFALLAAAGQWLNWREKGFEIVPTISLGIAALLMLVWPNPSPFWFIIIGTAMAVIHIVPLILRLWQVPARFQLSLELATASMAILLVPMRHFYLFDGSRDVIFALLAGIGAAIVALGAARGWKREERFSDTRFALLVAVSALLVTAMLLFLTANWFAPLAMASVAATVLLFGERAGDKRIERVASGLAGAALAFLIATTPSIHELARLIGWADGAVDMQAVLRWGGMSALFILLGSRLTQAGMRGTAQAVAASLAYGTIAQIIPGWSLPLGMAAVAIAMLALSARKDDRWMEAMAGQFGLLALVLLVITSSAPFTEWLRMIGQGEGRFDVVSFARWAGIAAAGLIFAARARLSPTRLLSQMFTTALAYGALAQCLPAMIIPIVPAAGLAALAFAVRRHGVAKFAPATGVLIAFTAVWAIAPLAIWAQAAVMSLGGVPMVIDAVQLSASVLLKQLLIPAALIGTALFSARDQLPVGAKIAGAVGASLLAVVGIHSAYRLGFASAFGTNFVMTGLVERIVWASALMGAGWLFSRGAEGVRRAVAIGLIAAGTLHTFYYTLILHNPIWDPQAVGTLPLLNLLVPAFALVPLGLWLIAKLVPEFGQWSERGVQLLKMLLVVGFAFAALRQIFVGSVLTVIGTGDPENILRSILAIALAIGFLVWGIRSRQRDWRIASLVLMLAAVGKVFLFDAQGLEGLTRIGSFVALGFSLIGIGWLYSRQLSSAQQAPD